MIKKSLIILGLFILCRVCTANHIHINNSESNAGDWVEIPIEVKYEDKVVGLQFDVLIPLEEIEEIDTTHCFSNIFKENSLWGCRQLDAPNADVIRYFVVTSDLHTLPSGEITRVRFKLKKNAYSGHYPVTIADKTLLAFDRQSDHRKISNHAGTLVINKGLSTTRPPIKTSTLFSSGKFSGTKHHPTALSRHTIEENWDVIANNPETLQVRLPDGNRLTFQRETFKPQKGFVARIDSDKKLPDPKVKPEERQFFWFGSVKGAEMGLTIHNGIGGGFITTAENSYSIRGDFSNTIIEKIDRTKQLAELCLSSPTEKNFADYIKPRTPHGLTKFSPTISKRSTSTNHTIRVLVMYTQQARTDAGGQANIDQLVQQSMNQLNQAVTRSGINNVQFELAGAEYLPGFYVNSLDNGTFSQKAEVYKANLSSLQANPHIQQRRNELKADLVVTLIRNAETGSSLLPACGLAFVQVEDCTESFSNTPEYCSRGVGYNDFAYATVSVDCAIIDDRHSFAHEVGHMMGLQHQRGNIAYPENRLIARFAYAHSGGYGTNEFHTLMWSSVGEPHYLNFSNPNITINGIASGASNYNDNASALLISAPTVEQYREAFNARIFADSFEQD